jgi:hypothetical protein
MLFSWPEIIYPACVKPTRSLYLQHHSQRSPNGRCEFLIDERHYFTPARALVL